ncbi:hypothetical protein GC197_15080 [bacterium]|nr:hypothetical protein [bacterium]
MICKRLHPVAIFLLSAVSALLNLPSVALAQAPVEPADLAQIVENAKSEFQPITEEQVATAKQTLKTKLAAAEKFLSKGSAANAKAWKAFLHWDELEKQLAAEQPDMRSLEEVYRKFRGSYAGLDKSQIVEARKALRTYINLEYFHQVKQYPQMYEMQLKTLSEALGRYVNEATEKDAEVIGPILGWLEQGNQVPNLIKSIRKDLDHPNLFVSISHNLVASGVRRHVDQTNPVREVILGTNVRGTAHMVGDVDVRFVPSNTQGLIELILKGTVTSKNVGTNGPATIHSTGHSNVTATKVLMFNGKELAAQSATADATTRTTYTGIYAGGAVAQRVATNRAYEKKGQAEAIAAQRTEARLEENFDNQTLDLLADANTRLEEKLMRPLNGRDAYPQELNVSTTPKSLDLKVMYAGQSQLAAPDAVPEVDDPQADFTVRLHESIIHNYGEVFLGGVKLTDEKLVELLEKRGAEVPEELKITPDTDPWSITFDYTSPIQVDFNNDTVKIGIRGRQFTRGESEVNRTISISADYKIEKGAEGTTLTRTGDVVVDFPTQQRLGPLDLTAKTFLRKKFEAVFKEEIVGEGIKLEGKLEKAGTLKISTLSVTPGWFVGTWKLEPPKAAPTAAKETASVVK